MRIRRMTPYANELGLCQWIRSFVFALLRRVIVATQRLNMMVPYMSYVTAL
jgi:hypothetical protein